MHFFAKFQSQLFPNEMTHNPSNQPQKVPEGFQAKTAQELKELRDVQRTTIHDELKTFAQFMLEEVAKSGRSTIIVTGADVVRITQNMMIKDFRQAVNRDGFVAQTHLPYRVLPRIS